jgi:hypothetical protein
MILALTISLPDSEEHIKVNGTISAGTVISRSLGLA